MKSAREKCVKLQFYTEHRLNVSKQRDDSCNLNDLTHQRKHYHATKIKIEFTAKEEEREKERIP